MIMPTWQRNLIYFHFWKLQQSELFIKPITHLLIQSASRSVGPSVSQSVGVSLRCSVSHSFCPSFRLSVCPTVYLKWRHDRKDRVMDRLEKLDFCPKMKSKNLSFNAQLIHSLPSYNPQKWLFTPLFVFARYPCHAHLLQFYVAPAVYFSYLHGQNSITHLP